MRRSRYLYRVLAILITITSLLLCPFAAGIHDSYATSELSGIEFQITYVPSIAPIEFHTEAPIILATAVAAGDLDSLEGHELPTYRQVNCGHIDDTICYELCYKGTCFVYGDDDDRVREYIENVDKMRDEFDKLELERIDTNANIWDTLGTCMKSLGAGFGAAGTIITIIVVAEPTGILKILAIAAAAISALGGGAGCAAAVVRADTDKEEQQHIINDFMEASSNAIFDFEDLKRDPPE